MSAPRQAALFPVATQFLSGLVGLVTRRRAAGSAVVAAAYFRQRIGGYTGDCLGAVQQVSELMFLLGALAVLRPAMPLS